MMVQAIQRGSVAVALCVAAPAALAATPADDGGDSAVSVLIGTDSAFDGDPATVRIRVQGEADIVDGGVVGLAGVLPITWLTAGTDSFGFSARQSVFEVPPSLRLRLLNKLWVRPYADLGIGMVITTESRDGFLMKTRDNNVGWMTRSGIGVELGATQGVVVQIEPFSAQTYHLGGDFARFSAMVGVGSRF